MAFLNMLSIDYSYGIVEAHPFQNIGKKLFSFLSVCIDTNLMKFSLIITLPVFFYPIGIMIISFQALATRIP